MRAILSVLSRCLTAGPGASELLAQTDQAPVFRSGVEVMEVDVTVVDAKGMPVRDLRAPEFTVTVDGQPRRVISAEFISESSDAVGRTREAARSVRVEQHGSPPGPPHHARGRSQQHRHAHDSRRGRGAQAVRREHRAGRPAGARHHSAAGAVCRFHDQPRADPRRHLAHHRARTTRCSSQYNISDYEAITFENRSNPIVTQRLLFRACGDTDPEHDVAVRSRRRAGSADDRDAHQAADVGSRCRDYAALLKNLRDVEGPKSMIILSQGLMLEGSQGEASALATLAAEARVSINVLMFAQVAGNASQSPHLGDAVAGSRSARGRPRDAGVAIARLALPRRDESGVRLRAAAATRYPRTTCSASSRPSATATASRIRFGCRWAARTCRCGPAARCSTRELTPNTWSRDVVMGRVLRSPAANTELPMRLSTYTFRDAAPNKVKLILAAEIDPESMEKELDLAIGFAIFDDVGKAVLSGQERKIYSANTDLPIRYELAVAGRSRHVPIAAGRRRHGREERQRRAGGAGVRHGEPRVRDRRSHPQLGARGKRQRPARAGGAAGRRRPARDLHRAVHQQTGRARRHEGDVRDRRHGRRPGAADERRRKSANAAIRR